MEQAALLYSGPSDRADSDDDDVHTDAAASPAPSLLNSLPPQPPRPWRERAQAWLSSKEKHYLILGLVSLDVLAILFEILVSLMLCDGGDGGGPEKAPQPWIEPLLAVTRRGGLVLSCLFVAELAASVWAFGWSFFSSWFHCFDAVVILVSFVVDVLAHGVVEEIASLVIVLRLWRMAKMIEEMSVGAAEQMEELEAQVDRLEQDKQRLEQEKVELERRLRMLVV